MYNKQFGWRINLSMIFFCGLIVFALLTGCNPALITDVDIKSADCSLEVSWVNLTAEGGEVEIWYGIDGTADTKFEGTINPESTIITGLSNDVEYTVVIKKIGTDAKVLASEISKATPVAGIVIFPLAPIVSGVTTSTSTSRPTWNFVTATGSLGIGKFEVKLNDKDFSTGAEETTKNSWQPATALADGSYTLYVRESDGSNWSEPGEWTVVVSVEIMGRPDVVFEDGVVWLERDAILYTNDTKPSFTVMSAEPDNTSFYKYKYNSDIIWSESLTGKIETALILASGANTLQVLSVDKSGKNSSIEVFEFSIDTDGPVITLNPIKGSVADMLLPLGADASKLDRLGSVADVVLGSCVDPLEPDYSAIGSSEGSYLITYQAHDDLGNSATAVTRTVEVVDLETFTITSGSSFWQGGVDLTVSTEKSGLAAELYNQLAYSWSTSGGPDGSSNISDVSSADQSQGIFTVDYNPDVKSKGAKTVEVSISAIGDGNGYSFSNVISSAFDLYPQLVMANPGFEEVDSGTGVIQGTDWNSFIWWNVWNENSGDGYWYGADFRCPVGNLNLYAGDVLGQGATTEWWSWVINNSVLASETNRFDPYDDHFQAVHFYSQWEDRGCVSSFADSYPAVEGDNYLAVFDLHRLPNVYDAQSHMPGENWDMRSMKYSLYQQIKVIPGQKYKLLAKVKLDTDFNFTPPAGEWPFAILTAFVNDTFEGAANNDEAIIVRPYCIDQTNGTMDISWVQNGWHERDVIFQTTTETEIFVGFIVDNYYAHQNGSPCVDDFKLEYVQ